MRTFAPPCYKRLFFCHQTSRAAISRLRMGYYEKVTVEFQEAFWPTDAPFIGCCPAASPAGGDSSSSPLSSAAAAAAPNGSRPLPPSAAPVETPCTVSSEPPFPGVESSPPPAVSMDHPHATATKAIPSLPGKRQGGVPTVVAPAKPVTTAVEVAKPSVSAVRASKDAFDALAEDNPAVVSLAPIFLENYLWSKGVPVLTAAITGERAHAISAAAAVAAASAAGRAGNSKGGDDWKEAHAGEVYRRLVKPSLIDAFAKNGKEIPEPVSVVVSRWVFVFAAWPRATAAASTSCFLWKGCVAGRQEGGAEGGV